jgi:hypothetical protein
MTTSIDLEFDTGTTGGALLGDIAASLVSLDELLRDLGSIAADPSNAEFRKIEIVAIELRSPLKVKLELFAIPPGAVRAFQAICRDIISKRPANREAALALCRHEGAELHITEEEAQRISGHIKTLQNAEAPLRRIEVKD